ncbi:hypothetical protein NPIL_275871 [Nephila pilipes]|uniref:Uncharacterized protein n=1 Tax=Nephila pilipes TaxID=299642 RepID=A0A8X6NXS5_NEPPI|nr:hypothetical protein NPIL_275871 [Nephila pilipes]
MAKYMLLLAFCFLLITASAAQEFLDDLEDVDGEGDIVENAGCTSKGCETICGYMKRRGTCVDDKCMCS